ncbi:hypothetical protein Dimus_029425 [Dionaea muscipula]
MPPSLSSSHSLVDEDVVVADDGHGRRLCPPWPARMMLSVEVSIVVDVLMLPIE